MATVVTLADCFSELLLLLLVSKSLQEQMRTSQESSQTPTPIAFHDYHQVRYEVEKVNGFSFDYLRLLVTDHETDHLLSLSSSSAFQLQADSDLCDY